LELDRSPVCKTHASKEQNHEEDEHHWHELYDIMVPRISMG
jgi:hypothetical protein